MARGQTHTQRSPTTLVDLRSGAALGLGTHARAPRRFSCRPINRYGGLSVTGSGLLLLEDLHTLLERLDAVLERLGRSGGLLEVLGRRPRLLARRLESL